MELVRLAAEVFACIQPDRGLGWSNSGLIARGGGLVVDTFWDLRRTRRLIETYAGVLPAPPRHVVNTHHNGDHCWGNQLFPEAEIVAHTACAAAFGRERPEWMEALRRARDSPDPAVAALARELEPWDFSGIELRPPTRTFDDELRIDLDGTGVVLIHVGPAHTAGDTIVHVPGEGVLFAGDIVFHRCTPLAWEGTFEQWLAALDRIMALSPAVVVPGHGPPGDLAMVREMKAYLEHVRAAARELLGRGLTAVEAAERIDPGPFRGWTQPERIVTHVMRLERELRGENPESPVDAAAVFRAVFAVREAWARRGFGAGGG